MQVFIAACIVAYRHEGGTAMSSKNNPYKRGNTWTIVYYTYSYESGKKKRKQHQKGGYKTREEAVADLKKIKAQVELGLIKDYSSQPLKSYLEVWFEKHKVDKDLQPNTINGYKVNIEHHIIPYIGDIKLKDLSVADIRSLHKTLLDKKLKAKTVVYVHNVLKAALKAAVIDGMIEHNVCMRVNPPTVLKYKHKPLTVEQIRTLFDIMRDDPYRPEVEMAAKLGLRRGEVLGIKVGDIDFDKNTLAISRQISIIKDSSDPDAKTAYYGVKKLKSESSNRVLTISKEIEQLIKDQIKLNQMNKDRYGEMYADDDFLFCDELGDFLSPQTLYHAFKRALKKGNLPDIRFHDLRHSYATLCIDKNIPIKVLSQTLGHSSTAVTDEVYADSITAKKELPNIIEKALKDDESK